MNYTKPTKIYVRNNNSPNAPSDDRDLYFFVVGETIYKNKKHLILVPSIFFNRADQIYLNRPTMIPVDKVMDGIRGVPRSELEFPSPSLHTKDCISYKKFREIHGQNNDDVDLGKFC